MAEAARQPRPGMAEKVRAEASNICEEEEKRVTPWVTVTGFSRTDRVSPILRGNERLRITTMWNQKEKKSPMQGVNSAVQRNV